MGIIKKEQNTSGATPSDHIYRVDLAKLVLYAMLDDANAYNSDPAILNFPVDRYVTPFSDLNYSNLPTNYDRAAKVLSYLYYANDGKGLTPFKRSNAYFYPYGKITRMDFLQVLLEAWNIDPNGSPTVPYNDDFTNVPVETMLYIRKAYALDIIKYNASTNPSFRPTDFITREEAYVIVSRLRKLGSVPKPTNAQLTEPANYILERNITTNNISIMRSMAEGNFVHSQGGFNIPDIGLPLSFGFTYNSFITQLPDVYQTIEPLGYGWTHNFNSYIKKTSASKDQNGQIFTYGKPLLLVANGDGTWHTFDNSTPSNPSSTSIDNFNILTRINDNIYELKRPDLVVFRYENQGGDDNGLLRLKSIKDRYGNTLTIVYKLGANIAFSGYRYVIDYVQAQSGRRATFSYNAKNQITEVSFPGEADGVPRKLKFAYTQGWDGSGNFLQKFFSPKFANQTTKAVIYSYGSGIKSRLLTSVQSPKGNSISTEFDTKNKLSKIEVKSGNQTTATTTFNRDNIPGCPDGMNCAQSTNANGTTTHHFEQNGNNVYVKSPTVEVIRPESINPTNQKDVNPSTPSFYVVNGNRAEYTYNGAGLVMTALFKKANGSQTIQETFTYDSNGFNNLETYTNPNGAVTDYVWSPDGKYLNLIKTPYAPNQYLNQTFTYYPATGQVQTTADHEGLTNKFTYDTHGNLQKSEYLPLSLSSTATYDYAGRIKSVTNPKGQTSQAWFDLNDNLSKEKAPSPLSYETNYGYDDNDNLTTITNAKNKVTTLGYDAFDRNDLLTFEGINQRYFYRTDGKLDEFRKSAFDTDNQRFFKYQYDTKGRLTGNRYVQEIIYDNTTQNLQSIRGGTSSSHLLKEYLYDDFNRLKSYKDHYNNAVAYDYDNNGNVTKITYPGSKFVTYVYDLANRLKQVLWNGSTTVAQYEYVGSRLDYVQYGNGVRTKYNYDNGGRLKSTSTNKNSGNGAVITAYTFDFDNLGNHAGETMTEPYPQPTLPPASTNYTYNDRNQIQTAGSVGFTHDGDGNVKTKANTTYAYDLEDNLIGISGPGLSSNFEYDAFGSRRRATRNGVETRYVLDALGLADVLAETNGSNAIQHYYIHGLGLVARVKPDGTLHYYHSDFRGSVIAMTNASQTVTHQYQYDDFGNVLAQQEADANPFKYVGAYGIMYEGGDLFYMRARYYDPTTGRFNGADPIWSTNMYPYAGNNGVMNVDPTGEIAWVVVGAIGGAAFGVIGKFLEGERDWKVLAKAGLIGGIQGAIFAAIPISGIAAGAFFGAVNGMASTAIDRIYFGASYSNRDLLLNVTFGAIAGAAGSPAATGTFGKTGILKVLKMSNTTNTRVRFARELSTNLVETAKYPVNDALNSGGSFSYVPTSTRSTASSSSSQVGAGSTNNVYITPVLSNSSPLFPAMQSSQIGLQNRYNPVKRIGGLY